MTLPQASNADRPPRSARTVHGTQSWLVSAPIRCTDLFLAARRFQITVHRAAGAREASIFAVVVVGVGWVDGASNTSIGWRDRGADHSGGVPRAAGCGGWRAADCRAERRCSGGVATGHSCRSAGSTCAGGMASVAPWSRRWRPRDRDASGRASVRQVPQTEREAGAGSGCVGGSASGCRGVAGAAGSAPDVAVESRADAVDCAGRRAGGRAPQSRRNRRCR
jgi:hypothetical protein